MTFEATAMWVIGGLLAGLLAGALVKRGGYGVRWDVILGLGGGLVGGRLFWTLGVLPEADMATMAVVAFVAAAVLIVGQRKIWPATDPPRRR